MKHVINQPHSPNDPCVVNGVKLLFCLIFVTKNSGKVTRCIHVFFIWSKIMYNETNYDKLWRAVVYSGLFCLLIFWVPVFFFIVYFKAYYAFMLCLILCVIVLLLLFKDETKDNEAYRVRDMR